MSRKQSWDAHCLRGPDGTPFGVLAQNFLLDSGETTYSDSMLRVRQLYRAGLEPADLDLGAGEILALSGPSGAGKTLLLRAIADLDPAEGEVSLDGAARERMSGPAWRAAVMYLAAEPGWWAPRAADHFLIPENMERMASRVGLSPAILGRPINELSTGERQRLAILRTLERGPRILLLDEPTAALDDDTTAQVETLLRETVTDGGAILFTSHDTEQIARLADRHITIARGRLGGTES